MEYSTYTVVQGNGKSKKHHFASGPFPAFAYAELQLSCSPRRWSKLLFFYFFLFFIIFFLEGDLPLGWLLTK